MRQSNAWRTIRAVLSVGNGLGSCLLLLVPIVVFGIGGALIGAGGIWSIVGWLAVSALAGVFLLIAGGVILDGLTSRHAPGDEPEYSDNPDGPS